MLSEEFSQVEIGDALKEAKEYSAPGPSGQIISFYKLLFMKVPVPRMLLLELYS